MVETKFKHTDIGMIPEDWEVKYVKDFTDCTAGGTPSTKVAKYWNGDIPWMNSGELNKRKIYNTHNFITKFGLENSSTKIIPENCVLIGLAGQGKTRGTVALNKISLSINQSIGAFYPNSIYNYNYLFFNLQNRYDELRNLSSGDGGRGGLNLNILKNLQIQFPQLPEQQAIAEVLSDTDNWIENLEKLIAKKQQIKQGAMQKLLTPKEDWELKKLGDCLDYIQPTPYLVKSTEYNPNNKIPVLTAGKTFILGYTNEELGLFNHLPTIIFDDFTTASKYVDFPFKAKSSAMKMLVLKNSQSNLRFLFDLMQSLKYQVGDHKRHWIGEFQNIEIKIPNLIEQIQIAQILSDMDAEIEASEQKLAKAKQIKQGLMQELLTGRIRLIKKNSVEQPQSAKKHNDHFNDAVLIGALASCFASEQYPMTRFKYTKVSYLLKRYREEQTEGYLKKAAGPYKPQTRYGGAEKIALTRKYVATKKSEYKNQQYEGFVSSENVQEAIDYFKKWYNEEALQWVNRFKFETNDNLELWATVDMAIQDLKNENKSISVETIKQVIKNNKEWKDKLKRAIFSDENIAKAIIRLETLYTTV